MVQDLLRGQNGAGEAGGVTKTEEGLWRDETARERSDPFSAKKKRGGGPPKRSQGVALLLAFFLLLGLTGCSSAPSPAASANADTRIYLYGETHSQPAILAQELERWGDYYRNDDMRHLFVELPYFTAEFLNVWMQSDSDDILNAVYDDTEGALSHTPAVRDFYRAIKRDYPETVFHGTDIGHQFDTTGQRYLDYLKNKDLGGSAEYALTEEAIEQGMRYYDDYDDIYRENTMVENFAREYDALDGERIMGIYGGQHVGLEALDYTNAVPCMANQLKQRYGNIIYSEELESRIDLVGRMLADARERLPESINPTAGAGA